MPYSALCRRSPLLGFGLMLVFCFAPAAIGQRCSFRQMAYRAMRRGAARARRNAPRGLFSSAAPIRDLLTKDFGWTITLLKNVPDSYASSPDPDASLSELNLALGAMRELGYRVPRDVVLTYGDYSVLNNMAGVRGIRHLELGTNILEKNSRALNLFTTAHELTHVLQHQDVAQYHPETQVARYDRWKDQYTADYKRISARRDRNEITTEEWKKEVDALPTVPPDSEVAYHAFVPFDELSSDLAGVLGAEKILPRTENVQDALDDLDPERKFTRTRPVPPARKVDPHNFFAPIRPQAFLMAKKYGATKMTEALREIGIRYAENMPEKMGRLPARALDMSYVEGEARQELNRQVLADLMKRFPPPWK